MIDRDAGDFGLLTPQWSGTRVAQLTSDRRIVEAMVDVELAWLSVLGEAGVVDRRLVAAAAEACRIEDLDLARLADEAPGGGNPLIPLLAQLRALTAKHDPAAAAIIHTGATSQDIVDSALMLISRCALLSAIDDLERLELALTGLVREHEGTLAVARTLGQHSLPQLFSLKAAQWLAGIGAAADQARALVAGLPLQWGGAAGTAAALTDAVGDRALDLTDALARELGLAAPVAPWQTTRWPVMRIASATAEIVAACAKIANDVALLSRPEIAELSEPKAAGRGVSSAMPQKQNPVLSVLVKSAGIAAPGLLAEVYAAAGAAVDERPDGAWHAEWAALRQLLRAAGGAAGSCAELAEGLEVHEDRMRANLELGGSLVLSERITAQLVPVLRDAGERDPKGFITRLIDRSRDAGRDFGELLREAIPTETLSDARLADLLDPAAYLGQAAAFGNRIIADRPAAARAGVPSADVAGAGADVDGAPSAGADPAGVDPAGTAPADTHPGRASQAGTGSTHTNHSRTPEESA